MSKYAKYNYYNHDINAGLNLIREKYRFNVGVSLQPQNTTLTYKKSELDTIVKRSVFNFAPNIDLSFLEGEPIALYLSRTCEPAKYGEFVGYHR